MILGVDASNIRAGGGVTHLAELLRAANPFARGFESVIVWGCESTLAKIEDREWLRKVHEPFLDRGLTFRVLWQRLRLKKLAQQANCDVLFVPGGSDASGFTPMVTMSQNLLPFEWREMRRYGWSFCALKFLLLRWTQSRSFRKADGVIFLTKYARDTVLKVTGSLRGKSTIIPHGVNRRFLIPPRHQRLHTDFSDTSPCRVLYVSIISPYKHQWQVAEAVARLRSAGVPVVLELVGPPAEGMNRLAETLNRVDPEGGFITYLGATPYDKLEKLYASADISVFASSCEAFGQVLTEAMSAGLPIACSNRSAMPEILGDTGVYFDPEDSDDIARALRKLIESPGLRAQMARAAFERAQAFSWRRCTDETFNFLAEITQVQNGMNEHHV